MGMPVNQSGSQKCALQIGDFPGLIVISDSRNPIAIDSYIGLLYLSNKGVYYSSVLDEQIGGSVTSSDRNQFI
jgi:hypothetical protein